MVNNIKNIPVGKVEIKKIESRIWSGGGIYVNTGLFVDPQSYTFPWTVKYALLFGEFYYLDDDRNPGGIYDYIGVVAGVARSSRTERVLLNPYTNAYETRYLTIGDTNYLELNDSQVSINLVSLCSKEDWTKSESYYIYSYAYLIAIGE